MKSDKKEMKSYEKQWNTMKSNKKAIRNNENILKAMKK